MNIASYITCFRILIGPIFLLTYLQHDSLGISLKLLPYVLLILLFLLELSDMIDGYLARKLKKVTDLGKILDPMADSIARISIFLTFTVGVIKLPMILVFVFIYRDSFVSMLRTICALRGFALAARYSGKVKAVIQAIVAFGIVLLLIPYSWGCLSLEKLRTISTIAVSVTALYSVISAVEYFYANRAYVKSLLKK